MSNPWESFPTIWKSKSAYFTWLRGLLRRGWNKSPVKIEFLKKHRYKIKNPSKGKKEIWGGRCNICKNEFPMKNLQVDHVIEAGSLKDFSDIEGFVTRLLACGEEDLQLACKGCHSIITHSQRHKLSFEDAIKDKARIEFFKQKAPEIKEKLQALGALEEDLRNAKTREEFYRKRCM